jgi:serine/threonine protein kinase/tetratricopeptide (TPR) repeat protein
MNPRAAPSPDDPPLARALREYLSELAEGLTPDRDLFLHRHADIAERLAPCLDGLQFVRRATPRTGSDASGQKEGPGPVDASPGVVLGDYRIVREIGRGGMGVVYEAEQLSLRRQVALKVLPFAAALDPRQRGRFQNEALAAAHLHHTNIVPVYGVGYERGVHFYAMQFIEGRTLAALIDDLRHHPHAAPVAGSSTADPTGPYVPSEAMASTNAQPLTAGPSALFRTAAELALQAAEALQHAHELGVIHRDVKPANLMVDVRGHLWVTDFGLARCQSEAGLTMSGDLLGTLRYMSPEQALAQRIVVDHRTDVYSLGVTLYELLTLRHAFPGRDRQELLRQIAFEEPVAPRRHNRAIPRDLETIVLKTMAKNPNERYPTAQELADDLRCFLDDRPIRARRPTLGQRLARWSRRHRPLVASTVLLLLMALVGLSLSTWLIWREKEETQAARGRAEAAAAVASAQRTKAQQQEALAKGHQQTAEKNLRRALEVLEQSLLVAEVRLPRLQGPDGPDRELLLHVLDAYQALVRENQDNPAVRHQIALGYGRVGSLQQKLGRSREAEKSFHQSIALFKKLLEESSRNPTYRRELGRAYTALGILLDVTGRRKESERWHRQCLTISRQLAREFPREPKYRSDIGSALHNLAMLLQHAGRDEEICRLLDEAIAEHSAALARKPGHLNYRSNLRNHYELLGGALLHLKKYDRAKEAHQQAAVLSQELVDEFPVPENWMNLARGYVNQAILLEQTGELEEALARADKGRSLWQFLATDLPRVPEYRLHLAHSHGVRATILGKLGQRLETVKALCRVIEIKTPLVAEFPDSSVYWRALNQSEDLLVEALKATQGTPDEIAAYRQVRDMRLRLTRTYRGPTLLAQMGVQHYELGLTLHRHSRLKEAEECYRAAIPLQQKSLTELSARKLKKADLPKIPKVRHDLMRSLDALARVLEKTSRAEEAVARYRQAQEQGEVLVKAEPGNALYCGNLAQSYHRLGALLKARGQLAEAEVLFERALAQARTLAKGFAKDANYQDQMGDMYVSLGRLLRDTGRPGEAEKAFRQAVAVFEAIVKAHPKVAGHKQDLAATHGRLANLIWRVGRFQEADEAYSPAIRLYEELIAASPKEAGDRNNLGTLYHNLGNLRQRYRNFKGSAEAYAQSLDLRRQLMDDFPKNPRYRREFANTQNEMGLMLRKTGQGKEAEARFLEAHRRRQQLVDEFPDVPDYQTELGTTLNNLGLVEYDRKELAKARGLLEQAIRVQRDALKTDEKNPRYRDYLRGSYRTLSEILLTARDRTATATLLSDVEPLLEGWQDSSHFARQWRRCARLAEKDAKLHDKERQALVQVCIDRAQRLVRAGVKRAAGDAAGLTRLAFDLVNDPEPSFRDPALAVPLAKQAVALEPKSGFAWLTLGMAHYRAGAPREAVAALTRSVELREGGNAFDWLYLAMAHHRLGERNKARPWFDRATAYLAKRPQATEAGLPQLHAEATALLQPREGKEK